VRFSVSAATTLLARSSLSGLVWTAPHCDCSCSLSSLHSRHSGHVESIPHPSHENPQRLQHHVATVFKAGHLINNISKHIKSPFSASFKNFLYLLLFIYDGSIILSSGDRFGISGYASDGTLSQSVYDTSGVAVYKSAMSQLGSNPMTTSGGPGTTTILVAHSAHGYETGDVVFIFGAIGFDGIPTSELNGIKTITKINNNSYTITTTTGATAGGVTGGGASIKVYNISRWGWRTRIAGIYSTDGGQPYTTETDANICRSVFYQRRSINQNPIIASALFGVANL